MLVSMKEVELRYRYGKFASVDEGGEEGGEEVDVWIERVVWMEKTRK